MSDIKESIKTEWKNERRKTLVYIVLRLLVIATLILQIFNRDWNNVFLCVLTLVLFMVPSFLEKTLKIDVPNTLEIIILLFIFSAEILGEINEYYIMFQRWDAMLHTLNGFLMAAIGLSLIDILNRSEKVHMKLDNKFVVLMAFCFSMTIGVLWEFFEYGMDRFFGMDMQKDTWITEITSAALNPDGKIEPVTVAIESVVINGETWPAYLDIGLWDTMADMFVNFIGAVVFSIFGALYLTGRKQGNIVKGLMPVITKTGDEISAEASEAKIDSQEVGMGIGSQVKEYASDLGEHEDDEPKNL